MVLGVSGEFYYGLRTNWSSSAAENGAAAMLCVRFRLPADLNCVAQGSSASHLRIQGARLLEMRAAQTNLAGIVF